MIAMAVLLGLGLLDAVVPSHKTSVPSGPARLAPAEQANLDRCERQTTDRLNGLKAMAAQPGADAGSYGLRVHMFPSTQVGDEEFENAQARCMAGLP